MKISHDAYDNPIVTIEFENGWTASIAQLGHGMSSCISYPTDYTEGTEIVGPQEAWDSEIVSWLDGVMHNPEYKKD